jgi:hypothetical protein
MSSRHQNLESELVAAMLLQVLRHSDNPELVAEATSKRPNPDKLATLLRDHNDKTHAELLGSKSAAQDAAPAPDSRTRRVNALLGKFGQ